LAVSKGAEVYAVPLPSKVNDIKSFIKEVP
jgi:hypothetical protein